MKSKIKAKKQKAKPTWPAFYKAKASSQHTVLFVNSNTGIVVCTGASKYPFHVGYFSDEWTSCEDVAIWQRLPSGAEVTLIQE